MNEIIDRDYYGEYEEEERRKKERDMWLEYQDELADFDYERGKEDDIR